MASMKLMISLDRLETFIPGHLSAGGALIFSSFACARVFTAFHRLHGLIMEGSGLAHSRTCPADRGKHMALCSKAHCC